MTALQLVLTALLLALNAFFVIAEYALVRARRAKLEQEAAAGRKGAALAVRQIDDINESVSTIQVGLTAASIGIGALGEPTIAHMLEPVLGGPLSHGAAVVISVVIAYLLITSAHIVIGEIVPKIYAIDRAETLLRRVARPLSWFRIVFAPFIVVLTKASYGILRLLGVNPERVAEEG